MTPRLRFFTACLAAVLFAISNTASPCTVFVVVRDGTVRFCNNEDFTKPGYVWFQLPENGKLGRLNLGFSDGFAQGAMNEAGLAFDAMALGKVRWQADPAKETPHNLLETIMDECRTVREALGYFETCNCRHLADGQFLLADASGDAALVCWTPNEGLHVTRIVGEVLLGTNTRLPASGYRCQRFVRAEQKLSRLPSFSDEHLAGVLDAVHQRGPGGFTSYSNIFDLKERRATLYNLANFEEPVTLDLAAELRKASSQSGLNAKLDRLIAFDFSGDGTAPQPLTKLFRRSPTLDDIRAGEQRVEFGTRIEIPAETLLRCVGAYSPEGNRSVVFRVELADGSLIVKNPGQPDATLFPESPTKYRVAPDRGQVTFLFDDPASDKATGLILHKQIDLKATRAD